ncbi:MAG: 3-hexulose-6-phosphate synthase [Chloroflexota bacterium]|nr:3-hexulose-6-phosphate synthase [Chloroflexota bacterium]
MLLQLALDGNLQQSLAVLQAAGPHVDIVEIGTPLVFREGMHIVSRMRELAPDSAFLADFKIMDAGDEEASIAFAAGCDMVTVMGIAHDETIKGAVDAALRFSREIVIDLMGVINPLARAREVLALGAKTLCVHTAYDVQHAGHSPLDTLADVRAALPEARVAVAGGISLKTIDSVVPLKPDIVIVGGAIARAGDPAAVAGALRSKIRVG